MEQNSAEALLKAAIVKKIKIATAESCTGGMIAARITDLPGSSAMFDRGFVTYSNEAKAEMLGVPLEHTIDPGAVSALVASEMARGAIEHSNAQCAVAVTGIAGPGGGSPHKPVGLVYIATVGMNVADRVEEFRFQESHNATTRAEIRQAIVEEALRMLLHTIEAA